MQVKVLLLILVLRINQYEGVFEKKESAFFHMAFESRGKSVNPYIKAAHCLFLLIVLVYCDPEDLKESLLMLCNNGHQLYRRQTLKMYRTRPTHLSPLTK